MEHEPSIEDADNPANVRFLLGHLNASMTGENPPPGKLSDEGITHNDARLFSELVLRSVRRATQDPKVSAVIEAEMMFQLAKYGIKPD